MEKHQIVIGLKSIIREKHTSKCLKSQGECICDMNRHNGIIKQAIRFLEQGKKVIFSTNNIGDPE